MKHLLCVLLSTFLMFSCATAQDSTLLGIGVGTVVGGGIGALGGAPNGNAAQGAAIGAVIMAAIGGLAGYLKFGDNERAKVDAARHVDVGSEEPKVSPAEIRRVWVDDKIEDNQLIKGHDVFILDKPSGFVQ